MHARDGQGKEGELQRLLARRGENLCAARSAPKELYGQLLQPAPRYAARRCKKAAKARPSFGAERRGLRSEVNSELTFPPNFEGLVLGCIDADFCK